MSKETIYGAVRVSALISSQISNKYLTPSPEKHWMVVSNPNVFPLIEKDIDIIFSDSLDGIYQKLSVHEIEDERLLYSSIKSSAIKPSEIKDKFKQSFLQSQEPYYGHTRFEVLEVEKDVKSISPNLNTEEIISLLKTSEHKIYTPQRISRDNYSKYIKNSILDNDTLNKKGYHSEIEGVIQTHGVLFYDLNKWKSRRYSHLNADKIKQKRLGKVKPISNNDLYTLYNLIITEFKRTGHRKYDKYLTKYNQGILHPFWDSYNATRSAIGLKSKKDIFRRILKLLYITKHFGNKREKVLLSNNITEELKKLNEKFIAFKSHKDYKDNIEVRVVVKYLMKFIYPRINNVS